MTKRTLLLLVVLFICVAGVLGVIVIWQYDNLYVAWQFASLQDLSSESENRETLSRLAQRADAAFAIAVKKMRSGTELERIFAIEVLGVLADGKSIAVLSAVFDYPEYTPLWPYALVSLATIRSPEAKQALEKATNHQDPGVRGRALLSLSRHADSDERNRLMLKALRDVSPTNQVWALGQLLEQDVGVPETLCQQGRILMEQSSDMTARMYAAGLLAKCDDSRGISYLTERMRHLLTSGEPYDASRYARVLVMALKSDATSHVIKALEGIPDKDQYHVMEVMQGITGHFFSSVEELHNWWRTNKTDNIELHPRGSEESD